MYIKFYGVRGSLAAPVSPQQIQAKITAIIERLTPKDLENEDTKTKFLSTLPDWLFGTAGGNTPCVEIRSKNGSEFIMDCGTGIRLLGKDLPETKDKTYHIFLSHYHWDHIQGFPFFDKIYDNNVKLEIYSGFKDAEKYMAGQNSLPYFPENACWDKIKNHIHFNLLEEGKEYDIDGVKVQVHKMTHPGSSYSFSLEEDGKKVIYATDVELKNSDFDLKEKRNEFFKNTDLIIFDCQYTNPEAIKKENWGHSSFSYAIDFAELWNIKKLYMFHHDPSYDDKKLDSILNAGKIYQNYKGNFIPELYLAQEGKVIEL